jgi:hypothetical protein
LTMAMMSAAIKAMPIHVFVIDPVQKYSSARNTTTKTGMTKKTILQKLGDISIYLESSRPSYTRRYQAMLVPPGTTFGLGSTMPLGDFGGIYLGC